MFKLGFGIIKLDDKMGQVQALLQCHDKRPEPVIEPVDEQERGVGGERMSFGPIVETLNMGFPSVVDDVSTTRGVLLPQRVMTRGQVRVQGGQQGQA